MSRIGNQPVTIPTGVTVKIDGNTVTVKGSKGELTKTFPDCVSVSTEGDQLNVVKMQENSFSQSMFGTTRALINNMVVGVSEGFKRSLEMIGVGYRANTNGQQLNLSLGFSHPIEYSLPKGVSASVEANTKIHLECVDKELLGQVAAKIRSFRPPEPYKGKGVRYLGEHVLRKEGKKKGK